tara:strand:+ start:110 stop:409 length:300 start_codon:yes stop_codon:yes gene_type:complete
MLIPTEIVIIENITIIDFGSGFIGPTFFGIIGVEIEPIINAIIETEINSNIENKIGDDCIGSLNIGCVSIIRFAKRGNIYTIKRNAKKIFPPLENFSLV